MGKVWSKLRPKKEVRILLLGLDGAGKSSVLYHLKTGRTQITFPTIGFHVVTLDKSNYRLIMWDIGGQDKLRNLWCHYFCKAAAIIFVVDCTDKTRISDVRYEMHHCLMHEELYNAIVLVFANKQDLPNAWDVAEITRQLQMHSVRQQWHVCATSARTGQGLRNGLIYLLEMLEHKV